IHFHSRGRLEKVMGVSYCYPAKNFGKNSKKIFCQKISSVFGHFSLIFETPSLNFIDYFC
ncbi:MAG: hypothetical protein ACI3ZT_08495, partial [Candidatus Cryptobacteroides sp.]